MSMKRRLQTGLSLIELMIAMVLGLLLMLGVIQIFLSSKQTYTANSALSRIQESGRFAIDFISYDLRNAGYRGECLSEANSLVSSPTDDRNNINISMKGWEAQTNLPSWPTNLSTEKLAGTDSILIKHAAPSAGTLGTTDVPTAGPITMTSANVANEAYVVISNALGCDLFKSGTNTTTSITKDSSGALSQVYVPAITKVLKFQSHQYYIKNGANGQPSLWRTNWNKGSGAPDSEELVEGIHSLQLEYGLGTGEGENRALSNSAFVKANSVTDWNNVVAVKVTLLAVGETANVAPAAQVFDREKGLICTKVTATEEDPTPASDCTAANSYDIPNRRLAQVFNTVVSLRNKIP